MNRPSLHLKQFLDQRGLTIREFARSIDVNHSLIHRVLAGGDACGRNWAKIERGTDGLVSPLSHFPAGRSTRARKKR